MKELETNMRQIEMEGLTWGASKLVPVGFGIKKLQVNLVVEDEKVSIDDLQAKIEEDEDHVQSTDVVSTLHLSLIHSTEDGFLILISTGCYAKVVSCGEGSSRISLVLSGMSEMSLDFYTDHHDSKNHRSFIEEHE